MTDFVEDLTISRIDTVVASEADGVLSMMHLVTGQVHDLSGVGRLIWDSLVEPRTVSELVEVVAERYPSVSRDRVRADIVRFLAELDEAKLIST